MMPCVGVHVALWECVLIDVQMCVVRCNWMDLHCHSSGVRVLVDLAVVGMFLLIALLVS